MKKYFKLFVVVLLFFVSISLVSAEDKSSGCLSHNDKGSCENDTQFSCIWNETQYGNYCNTDNLLYVACGDSKDIPEMVPKITSFLINALKIVTPIILIIVSSITLLKALTAQKEDEINKAKSSLIRKIIIAALIFFVISIVQFVVLKAADESEKGNITNCLSCFIDNECGNSVYYKTNIAGTYYCTSVGGTMDLCD